VQLATRTVGRVTRWADDLQRRVRVLGFGYAVVKKYGDDAGGRQAALITYYGFLSLFPLLLLGTSVLSRILVGDPHLRTKLIDAVVPESLRGTVEQAVTSMPASGVPFAVGLVGLLFTATGVVFSAQEALNHLVGVPIRLRPGFLPRYVRVLLMLVAVLLAALAIAALTVGASALPNVSGLQRAAGAAGIVVVVFGLLLLAGRLLVARPVPVRSTWPSALLGAVIVAAVLTLGTRVLSGLVHRSGPVYGTFATVVGAFALLYLVSQGLLYAAEVGIVRHGRLWPRALDSSRPTEADLRVLGILAREQERLERQRITSTLLPAEDPADAP
jgi:uncharacterized BrkB/YihY/UPF0761 family membrane protein